MTQMIVKGLAFEGRGLTAVTMAGRPMVIAKELGAVLEYGGDGTHLTDLIRGPWSAEFIDTTHFVKAEGQVLADLKRLTESESACRIGPRARSVILLSEAGVNLVLLRTERPVGIAVRRYLAETIMPALARGEGIPARGEVAASAPLSKLDVEMMRQQRMSADLAFKREKWRVQQSEALCKLLAKQGVDERVLASAHAEVIGGAAGIRVAGLLPEVEERYEFCEEIATRLCGGDDGIYGSVFSQVGRIISQDDDMKNRTAVDGLVRVVMSTVNGSTRPRQMYSPAAVRRIEDAFRAGVAAPKGPRTRKAKASRKVAEIGTPTPPEQGQLGFDGEAKKKGSAS